MKYRIIYIIFQILLLLGLIAWLWTFIGQNDTIVVIIAFLSLIVLVILGAIRIYDQILKLFKPS